MSSPGLRGGHGLLRNSAAIAAASNLTAGLGYLFWTACARNVTASELGMTITVVSAMLLVGLLAAGGFVPLLIRTLSTADREEFCGLSGTALVLVAILAGAGGTVASLSLPASVHAIVGTPTLVGIMGTGSAGAALLLLVSAILVGVRRADFSLVGNVAASLSRLAMVMILVSFGALSASLGAVNISTILLVWLASFAISLILSIWLLVRAVPGFRARPGRGWLPRLGHDVGWEHLTTLGAQLPPVILPVLAARRLPIAQVSYMYMALMVGAAFFSVAAAMSTALLADCPDPRERVRSRIHRSLGLTGAVLVAPGVVTCLFAPQMLGLFGADYSRYGSTLLILLVLASLPDMVTSVAVSVLRLQGKLARAAALNMSMAAVYLLGSWFTLPHLGIAGAGWSALAAQSLGMTAVLLAAGYGRARGSSDEASSSHVHDGPSPLSVPLGRPVPSELLIPAAAGTVPAPLGFISGDAPVPDDMKGDADDLPR
jgi:O-antigen/teichoic acid export membrane protein